MDDSPRLFEVETLPSVPVPWELEHYDNSILKIDRISCTHFGNKYNINMVNQRFTKYSSHFVVGTFTKCFNSFGVEINKKNVLKITHIIKWRKHYESYH